MGFLNPWFLLGLAAIGLPVYIHLLRRHVLPPQPFSSLMFFKRGTQSSTHHRRLRYLLLFSLRTALLLLLVLAFANPFLRRAAAGADNTLLLVVVDNSFSMRAGSKFADAKRGALDLLASRPRAQKAQVMALGGRLAILTQPIQDAGALRSAVESIQVGDSRANLGELAHGVHALVETVHTPVALHLFSDMQKTGMPANFADMALPANVTVVLHPEGTLTPNWTVESVNIPAKATQVQAVIAGYGTPAATKTVSLLIDGRNVATRKVDIPANGRATVEFPSVDVPYGLSRCAVRIDVGDGFAADDSSLFSVRRSDPERVLFVHQASDKRSGLYFGSALAATSQASFTMQSIDSVKANDVDPAKYAFVVLSDTAALPSIFENALMQYVRRGGNVLVAAGTSAAHHGLIPIFAGRASDPHNGSASVGQTDLTYPVMNEATGWGELKIDYATVVDPGQARVIVRLTDQTPLLMEKQIGEGHVLLFASGFDNLTNDLPVRPAFVPFVGRAARYLSGNDSLSGSRLVDTYIPLSSGGVEILDPDGHRALSLNQAATAQSFQFTRAGFYKMHFVNGKDALIGVNPDRRESDLQPISNDLLKLWASETSLKPTGLHGPPSVAEKYTAHSVWWYVMLLVLVAAVAESIVASRYLGTQREEA